VERSGIRVGKRREAPARIAIVRAPLAFRKTVKFVAVTTVMAGLVPAISIIGHWAILIEIAVTSPAMTP